VESLKKYYGLRGGHSATYLALFHKFMGVAGMWLHLGGDLPLVSPRGYGVKKKKKAGRVIFSGRMSREKGKGFPTQW